MMTIRARLATSGFALSLATILGFASARGTNVERFCRALTGVILGPIVAIRLLAAEPRVLTCWNCAFMLVSIVAATGAAIYWHWKRGTLGTILVALFLWSASGLYYWVWMWT